MSWFLIYPPQAAQNRQERINNLESCSSPGDCKLLSTAHSVKDWAPPLHTRSPGREREASIPRHCCQRDAGLQGPPPSPLGWPQGFVSLDFAPQPLSKARNWLLACCLFLGRGCSCSVNPAGCWRIGTPCFGENPFSQRCLPGETCRAHPLRCRVMNTTQGLSSKAKRA